MNTAGKWARLFQNWPEQLSRRGLITTTVNELIPFKGFMFSDDTLLLERTTPDPSGTRFVLLGFESIAVVKLIDAVERETFSKIGFLGRIH